jgi:hypothetical protein
MAVAHPMTARRVLEVRRAAVARTDAKLYAGVAWTGLAMTGLGAAWIGGWSPGLRQWPALAAVLGVLLMCSGAGLLWGSARRHMALLRVSALAVAAILATAAAFIVWSTANGAGAVSYVALAGLHVVWAMRSD